MNEGSIPSFCSGAEPESTVNSVSFGDEKDEQALNNRIIKNQDNAVPDLYMAVSSDFDFGGLKCVLVFPRSITKPNIKLFRKTEEVPKEYRLIK